MIYLLHLLGLAGTAAVAALAAWWVRAQTRDRAGTVTIVLLVVHGLMAAFAFVQYLDGTYLWQTSWQRLGMGLGFFSTPIWALLAIYYAGHERWLSKPVWVLVLALPTVAGVLTITDPLHGIEMLSFAYESEPFPRVIPVLSDFAFVLFSVLGLYFLFTFGMFLRMFLFPRRRSRWQPGAVLVGILAMYVAMSISSFADLPVPGFPYSIYGTGIFSALIAVALFRTEFFAVTPLAHETIFDSIDDAILVVDARKTIVDYNDPALEVFPNLSASVGDPLEDAYPALLATDRSRADGGGAEAIVERLDGNTDTPFAETVRVAEETGSRTLRVSVSEITAGGEPRGYVLFLRDVTDLERYAVDLEHKTDQLERYASVLSHDLRNPVAVAMGYTETARETGDVAYLEDVEIALGRIDETIEDLLTLSREGESIDETEPVSLHSLVTDAWSTTDTRGVLLTNSVDPDYRIRADPSRVRTLLENLFRNAADHGGETVRVESLEDGTGFAVEDDGPGIPQEKRETVFEYGYSSTSDGTGLGLSIVDSVATAHGWSLSVTDGEDGGARFTFENVERVYHDADANGGEATEETEAGSTLPRGGSESTA